MRAQHFAQRRMHQVRRRVITPRCIAGEDIDFGSHCVADFEARVHDLVAKLAERAGEIEKGLKNGDYKRCKKCDRDLPIEKFEDVTTKSGMSRYCQDCKSKSAPSSYSPRLRRSYRRW